MHIKTNYNQSGLGNTSECELSPAFIFIGPAAPDIAPLRVKGAEEAKSQLHKFISSLYLGSANVSLAKANFVVKPNTKGQWSRLTWGWQVGSEHF